jgi:WhiB family redox-sensing transcriptional regulator
MIEKKEHWEASRDEVRTMTVLFSELLVPGWAQDGEKIGLGAVTGAYGSDVAFALPCHNADPDLFFSETTAEISLAKSLCGQCPVQRQCLEAALSRQEPCGVWGGELFEDGSIIAKRRTVGRPRLTPSMEPYPAVAVTGVTLPVSVDQISEEAESNAA